MCDEPGRGWKRDSVLLNEGEVTLSQGDYSGMGQVRNELNQIKNIREHSAW
jgi:hypothetical protein